MHYLLTIRARVEADSLDEAESILVKGSVPLEQAGATIHHATAERVPPEPPAGVQPGRTHYWNPDESDAWQPKVVS